MKNLHIIIVIVFIISISCKKRDNDLEVKSAIKVVLDSVINKRLQGNFVLYDKLSEKLSDSMLVKDLNSIKFIDSANVEYFKQQNTIYKGKLINDFISNEYKTLLVGDLNLKDSTKFFVEMSPPLYTKDKLYFIIYIITIVRNKTDFNWGDNYLIFYNKYNKWKLKSIVK